MPRNCQTTREISQVDSSKDELFRDKPKGYKMRVGVIGLGKLGKGLLFALSQEQWVEQIHAFSSSYNGDYGSIEIDIFSKRHKVLFHQSLNGIIAVKPDLLFVAAGARIENFSHYETREQLRTRLYEDAIPKLKPIFSLIKKERYPGLICVMTNPPGDHLYAASEVFKINPWQLTSFSPGTRRAIGLLGRSLENLCMVEQYHIDGSKIEMLLDTSFSPLCRWSMINTPLRKKHKKIIDALSNDDVHLAVIGEHGKEIPLFETCLIGGQPLFKMDNMFKDDRFQQQFQSQLRNIGHRLMKALEVSKGSYYTAPNVAVEIAREFHDKFTRGAIKVPRQTIHCFIKETGSFLSLPATAAIVDGHLQVAMSPDFSLEKLLDKQKREIKMQIQAQQELLGRVHSTEKVPCRRLWEDGL